jgi:hypothetical protein
VIAAFVSINSVLAYIDYRKRKDIGAACTLNSVGTVFGFATGICSSCVAGIVPIILGWLGVAAGWASLPLQGIEIQIMTIAILGVGFYYLK